LTWAEVVATWGPDKIQDAMKVRAEWEKLTDDGMTFMSFYMEWDRLITLLTKFGQTPSEREQVTTLFKNLKHPRASAVLEDIVNEALTEPLPVPRVHTMNSFWARTTSLAGNKPAYDNMMVAEVVKAHFVKPEKKEEIVKKKAPWPVKTNPPNLPPNRGDGGRGRGRGRGGARENFGGRGRGGPRGAGRGDSGGARESRVVRAIDPYGPQAQAQGDGVRNLPGCWRCGDPNHFKHDYRTDKWCEATKCTVCHKYIGNDLHDSRTCVKKRPAEEQGGVDAQRGRS
jgi:hypothetical protein